MEKGLFEVLTEICNEKGISQEVCSIFIVLHRRLDFDTGARCAFSTSLFAMEGVAVIFMYVIVTLFNGLVHKIIQRYY